LLLKLLGLEILNRMPFKLVLEMRLGIKLIKLVLLVVVMLRIMNLVMLVVLLLFLGLLVFLGMRKLVQPLGMIKMLLL